MHIRHRWLAYAFVMPAVLLVGGLMYYPMFATFVESLYRTSFIDPRPVFAGIDTYRRIFSGDDFWQVLGNSLIWTTSVVVLQNAIGFAVALLLNEKIPGRALARSLVLLPWVLPGVVAAVVWRFMYDPQLGLVNSLLLRTHLTTDGADWLADPHTAMAAVVVAAVWKGFPFSTVIYLAALQGVDQEQVEAATLDGAGASRRLWDFVLPALRPVIALNVLLTMILTFNYFDMIWVLTRGGPLNATHIFPTRIYELGFGEFRFGEAAAYGSLSVAILFVLMALLVVVRRSLESGFGEIARKVRDE